MGISRCFIAILLCLVMIMALCACNDDSATSQVESSGASGLSGNGENTPSGKTPGSSESTYDHSNDYWYNEEGLTAPTLSVPEEKPEAVAEEFITALQNSDWETVSQRMGAYTFSGGNSVGVPEGGILEAVMQTMTVTELKVTDQGDGTYRATMTVEAVDVTALMDSVSNHATNKDMAHREMRDKLDTADRKQFPAEFTILRYRENGPYFVEPEESLLNAITGGFLDAYMKMVEEVKKG